MKTIKIYTIRAKYITNNTTDAWEVHDKIKNILRSHKFFRDDCVEVEVVEKEWEFSLAHYSSKIKGED